MWHYDSKGLYSVKSACKVVISCVILPPHPIKAHLRPIPITKSGEPLSQERSKYVLGRLVSIFYLLVRTWRKKVAVDNIYVLCSSSSKSVLHVFNACPFS